MEFGVSLANVAGYPAPVDRCLEIAQSLDALGFDSVWVHDHVARPVAMPDGHDGVSSPYEPLMLVSALASLTQRIQIGTLALTLPLRHPAITAKMLAAADLLSGGRIVLGVGVGSAFEEFEALNLPNALFERRVEATDEYLRAIKEMWTSTGPSNFTGEFVAFRDVGAFPKPAHKPHPPVMVAGDSPEAMVLASRQADIYLAPFVPPAEFAAHVREFHDICRRDRRDPAEVPVSMLAPVVFTEAPQHGERASLTGTPEQLWQDLRLYGRAGLDHLIMVPGMAGETSAGSSAVRAIELFAAEILPAFHHSRTHNHA